MILKLGAHTSAAKGSFNALKQGKEIEALGVQLFTSNQKQWKGRTISEEEVALWKKTRESLGIFHNMSHASYLINLGSPSQEMLQKSRKAFEEELKRCHLLEIPFLNFHPGAAISSSEKECLDTIVESLNTFEELAQKGACRLLLETTAGQGTSVGHKFEHLAYILQNSSKKLPLGVCIDTCHIFAAGYDIRTKEALEATLEEFDRIVGLKNLYALHLNDSKKELGSKRDRHAPLGKGFIGLEGFHALARHPKLNHLPMYLETPEPALWKEEIALLQKLAKTPL